VVGLETRTRKIRSQAVHVLMTKVAMLDSFVSTRLLRSRSGAMKMRSVVWSSAAPPASLNLSGPRTCLMRSMARGLAWR